MSIVKNFKRKIKSISGNSLAEFAVTIAMMATLATTAAPRFSGIGEGAKAKKTLSEIDKIVIASSNFYNSKVTTEGRGRFPGQERYDTQIGGYERLTELESILNEQFNKWDDAEGSNWRSVFGTAIANPSYAGEYNFTDDDGAKLGPTEWYAYLSREEGPIVSPYQQGHYIYIVIPGGQKEYLNPETGEYTLLECNECGPIMVVADAYNPSKFWTVKSFN